MQLTRKLLYSQRNTIKSVNIRTLFIKVSKSCDPAPKRLTGHLKSATTSNDDTSVRETQTRVK